MKKMREQGLILLAMILVFSNISPAGAQMIDYSRMKKNSGQLPQDEPAPTTLSKEQKSSADTQKEIPVRQRSEEVYDKNNDGQLQEEEVRALLADVVSSVEMWGQAQLNSDLLVPYDADNNGTLDVQEAASLRAVLDQ